MVTCEPIEDLRYLFDALCVNGDNGHESSDSENDDDCSSPAVRRRGPLRRETAPRPCPYDGGWRSPSPDFWPSSVGSPSSVDSAVSLSSPTSSEASHSPASSVTEQDDDPDKEAKVSEILRFLLGAETDHQPPQLRPEQRPELPPDELPVVVEALNNQAPRFRKILPRVEDSPEALSPPPSTPPRQDQRWPRREQFHKSLDRNLLNRALVWVTTLRKEGLLERRDSSSRTYVHEAVASDRPEVVYQLVERLRRDQRLHVLDLQDSRGQTALHYACQRRLHLVVGYLCEVGADRALRDHEGATPLHLAAERGAHLCVDHLLAPPRPSPVHAQDNKGRTALHLAVLSHGGQLCDQSGGEVHYELLNCHQVVKQLAVAGSARLELQDRVGETALHYAAQHGKAGLAQVLLLNADRPAALAAVKNLAGDTALHMACRSQLPGEGEEDTLVHLLVHHGAPLEALNNSGLHPADLLSPERALEVGLLLAL